MTTQVRGFQTPKNGSNKEECQDAMSWDEKNAIFAIADGVSDSAFQKLWADMLVKSFVAKVKQVDNFSQEWLADWLETEQKEWNSQVNWEEIPWHGKMKAQQTGGEATFLGIRLLPEKKAWTGIAIGDCNLFRFSKDLTFKENTPIKRSTDFSNATQAFSSLNKNPARTLNQVIKIQGSYEPGDYLILATDAMARWMLERLEEKKNPLKEIPTSSGPEAFNNWIHSQRQNGRIKDDDSSVMLIQVEPVVRKAPVNQTEKPRPVPVAPQQVVQPRLAPVSKTWIYILSIALVVFSIGSFFLGATWQNRKTASYLEENVQKPLFELVTNTPPTRPSSMGEILMSKSEILIVIEAIRSNTETGRQAYCMLKPTDKICTQNTTKQ